VGGRKSEESNWKEQQAWLAAPENVSDRVLLIQWIERKNSRLSTGANAGRIHANQGVFFGAKSADAGRVDRDWRPENRIADVDATGLSPSAGRELISALAAASRVAVVREHRINHARCRRTRNASRTQRPAEVHQRRSIAHRRIRALIGDFPGGDRSHRVHSRGLVRGHAGPEQVGNSNGGNDQNDRHHNQQLDQ
jgi:hypothetical protein